MTWNIVHASAVGTAHHENGQPCQDASYAENLRGPDGEELLICLVADGAGSAAQGGKGAQLACELLGSRIAADWPRPIMKTSPRLLVEDWVETVRLAIGESAAAEGLAMRDYACTLLGAVIAARRAIFFQIGDGAIVAAGGSAQGVVFWPEVGLYANMTHFLTDEDALAHLQVWVAEVRIEELALFSDGLQRLALNFAQHCPHTPFFEPMFDQLRTRPSEARGSLNRELAAFLGSAPVNARTDDDKTLVLATRRAPC